VAFVGKEPEGLFAPMIQVRNNHRAAGRNAEFIADELRRRIVTHDLARLGYPEGVVAGSLERGSMQAVGARPTRHDYGGRSGVLRASVPRLDVHLLDGIGVEQL